VTVSGIKQVVLEVEDQDRALAFWTGAMGFDLAYDGSSNGDDERWLEVRTPDHAVTVVLRHSDRKSASEGLPMSNVFFHCENVPRTYEELHARGVEFPQPPVQQPFGWWSIFEDSDGNRFALTSPLTREASRV
jgi:predicted enzyme related to lactoylglutathione lyase